jgi:uncharacterized protein (TIGR01244 family)
MPRAAVRFALGIAGLLLLVPALSPAQDVRKDQVAGIRNLARIDSTIACAGAITADAVPEIKKMGFASIVNLRLASEEGAEVEKEAAAAKAAGLRYFHVPYDGSADEVAAGKFLDAITSRGAEPFFVHCAGGNRAATMWLIKRVAIDHWDDARATKEAEALGQTNPKMREFALAFAHAHRR